MEIEEYRNRLDSDEDLIDYINEKEKSKWYYERYLYFKHCVGNECKFADACVKILKEDIDGYYSKRQTDNVKKHV